MTIQDRLPTAKPAAPKPPNAKETQALIEAADQDMFLAQKLDNQPGDQDGRKGVVDVPAQGQQPAYERYYEGDTSKGNICRDARKMTEFDGNLVKISYSAAVSKDGQMGTEETWFLMDRTQPGKSTSGARTTFLAGCE